MSKGVVRQRFYTSKNGIMNLHKKQREESLKDNDELIQQIKS